MDNGTKTLRADRAALLARDAERLALLRKARVYLREHTNHHRSCPFASGGPPSSECCPYGRLYADLSAVLEGGPDAG